MKDANDIQKPFMEFAQQNAQYYANVFDKIQRDILPKTHINKAALFAGVIWASLRGNWTLFWIAFIVDLLTIINGALVYKYLNAALEEASKDYLVERYEGWANTHLIFGIIVFIGGRILFAWLADRIYFRQYNKWRIDNSKPSGRNTKRLINLIVIVSLIFPMMIYRTTQFAPDERTCIKQDRAMQKGEIIAIKDRFDCMFIGEFPTLFWVKRPDEITYPRDDNGNRVIKREKPREGLPPINLNTYAAQLIDDGIGYLTAFYGYVFDGITNSLRGMLTALTSVFVGTPWIITMGVLLAITHILTDRKTTIFVGITLGYLAFFGFWHTAMDTMALVASASIICVVFGLPLGVWVGKSKRGEAIMTPILDVMQTIPSFVYLLPAIAFFSIGKPPGILATVIFAMPPMVRLSALGVRHVPENTKEAALAFGASPRQLLFKVELPLALPSIMAGINQVVMMSLSMVVIAALIGAGGMGYRVTEALANTETGRGILAGIGIALLAMMIDRIVQRANKNKK